MDGRPIMTLPTDSPQRSTCTAILPFHNERDRILPVLAAVYDVDLVSRIICVDDGSTDGASAQVIATFPDVTLLCLPDNQGKAAAVAAGLEMVETSHVLLVDADLRDLRASDLTRALDMILHDTNLDMVLLRRMSAGLHARLLRGDLLFTGERVLKTADLRAVLACQPTGYQLEIAVNAYMIDHGRTVRWAPSSARNILKIEKQHSIHGLMADMWMARSMLSHSGVRGYAYQYLFFAHKRGLSAADTRAQSAALRQRTLLS